MLKNNTESKPMDSGVLPSVKCKSSDQQFYIDKTLERKGMEMEMDKIDRSANLAGGRNIWLRTDDGKSVVNQIILQESEKIPENSTIYNINLQVVFGRVGLKQNDTEEIIYNSGNVINIPAKTKICLSNQFEKESTVYVVRV